jgi:hypothetical protein
VFSTPENAVGVLRALVPAALERVLDWSTLELVPGTFVDDHLAHRHTDLLYAVRSWKPLAITSRGFASSSTRAEAESAVEVELDQPVTAVRERRGPRLPGSRTQHRARRFVPQRPERVAAQRRLDRLSY